MINLLPAVVTFLLAGASAGEVPPPVRGNGFDRLDQNGDGVISREEFADGQQRRRERGAERRRDGRRFSPPHFSQGEDGPPGPPPQESGCDLEKVIRRAIDDVLSNLPREEVDRLQPMVDAAVGRAIAEMGDRGRHGGERRGPARRGVFRDDDGAAPRGPGGPPPGGFGDGARGPKEDQFNSRRRGGGRRVRDGVSPEEAADRILARADKNGDGVLTRDECKRRAEQFDRLDLNKDGKLDRQELTQAGPGRGPRGDDRPKGPPPEDNP